MHATRCLFVINKLYIEFHTEAFIYCYRNIAALYIYIYIVDIVRLVRLRMTISSWEGKVCGIGPKCISHTINVFNIKK